MCLFIIGPRVDGLKGANAHRRWGNQSLEQGIRVRVPTHIPTVCYELAPAPWIVIIKAKEDSIIPGELRRGRAFLRLHSKKMAILGARSH